MNAQKRRARPFEGMTRKAIVVVPSEEDYKTRIEAQEKAESKDVPDNAVMEMKGIKSKTKRNTYVYVCTMYYCISAYHFRINILSGHKT